MNETKRLPDPILKTEKDTLFGFPIIWNENIPVGKIVLADWLTYLKFKKKAEEYEAESERRDSGLA